MRPWTCKEIEYLCEHSTEGVASISLALNRSKESVRAQAHRRGISVRKRWHCPKCCSWTYRPLDPKTGWCVVCTLSIKTEAKEQEVAEYMAEVDKEAELRRRMQAAYARKHRAKKKLDRLQKECAKMEDV